MKNYPLTMCFVILMAVTACAEQITLKDGRTVQGEIIEKNDQTVKMNVDGNIVTYFKDQIVNENEDGEELARQLTQLIPSQRWAELYVQGHYKQATEQEKNKLIATLDKEVDFKAVDKIRIKYMLKYYSPDVIKAVVAFYSSPEGKIFIKDVDNYYRDSWPEVGKLMTDALAKAKLAH